MSARALARKLAEDRAGGRLLHLSAALAGGTPADLREVLLGFYALRDAVARERVDLAAAGASLRERLVAAGIAYEIEEAIGDARRQLSKVARSTGAPRAFPGCRGGAPAVMGHGCPALLSAVGPAHADQPDPRHNIHENPLFCAQEVQELPLNIDQGDTHQREEERQC